MRIDFLQTLQMRYRAEMLAANANIRTYLENPSGIGEHSDLIESVDVEVRKYNEAKELITSVSNLIEFYKKKQVEQEQKVAPQPVVEPEEPQEPQGPRTTEPVSE
jgi:hypothetical protein